MAFLRSLLALPVVALALLAGGCYGDDEAAYSDLDASALEERFACDDLTLVAADATGHRALLIGIDDGLAASVLASGEAVEIDYELPDERVTVRWVEGNNVYQGHCGRDNGSTWELDERTDAVTGELFVRLSQNLEGELVLDAELSEVLLAEDEAESADGHEDEDHDEGGVLLSGTSFEGIPVDS